MYSLLDVVHCRDCGVCVGILTIADEAETTTTTSVAVFYDNLQYNCWEVAFAQPTWTDLRLLPLGQTLQTWHAERYRRCAMLGHCSLVRFGRPRGKKDKDSPNK